MKRIPLLSFLALAAASTFAADDFPLDAGNGEKILSPIDRSVVKVTTGKASYEIPPGMVLVPAGSFRFGDRDDSLEVELPDYAIGKFEVTNAEYAAFLEDGGDAGTPRYWENGRYPEGKANHPVLFVSFDDASAYCDWIREKTGRDVAIPSAEQWEKAARGTKGGLYPWGDEKGARYSRGKLESRFNFNAVCAAYVLAELGDTKTVYVDRSGNEGGTVMVKAIANAKGDTLSISPDGGVTAWIDHSSNLGFVNTRLYRDMVDKGGYTTPVGSYEDGKSPYGCYDMAGNAYEWTSSVITATNGAERGREVNDVRGGSWYSTGRSGVSICTGEGRARSGGYHSVGFRIAMNLNAAEKAPQR